MTPKTAELWAKQDRQSGDRCRLFTAVSEFVRDVRFTSDSATSVPPAPGAHARTRGTSEAACTTRVFYPGSFVDLAPSFVFPSVVYLDVDERALKFFSDEEGCRKLIAQHGGPRDASFRCLTHRSNTSIPHASVEM